MKNIWLWVIGGIVIVWLWMKRKPAASPVGTVATTGTQQAQAPWFAGWNGFTPAQLDTTTKNVGNAFNSLKALANNFGLNDGGTNPGVSVSGSHAGGVQSAGGGAGLPVNVESNPNLDLTPAIIDQYGVDYVPLNQWDGGNYGAGELSPDGFAA